MKYSILGLAFLLTACFPSMRTGPDPHSIEFEVDKFNKVISYFIAHQTQGNFDIEKAPKEIPVSVREQMKEIGLMEFRNIGPYMVFFCGYGVVGKGWGFIYGDFTNQPEDGLSFEIKGNNQRLELTYLEKLEGKWYRFAAK